jgi:hypothetical protein
VRLEVFINGSHRQFARKSDRLAGGFYLSPLKHPAAAGSGDCPNAGISALSKKSGKQR